MPIMLIEPLNVVSISRYARMAVSFRSPVIGSRSPVAFKRDSCDLRQRDLSHDYRPAIMAYQCAPVKLRSASRRATSEFLTEGVGGEASPKRQRTRVYGRRDPNFGLGLRR